MYVYKEQTSNKNIPLLLIKYWHIILGTIISLDFVCLKIYIPKRYIHLQQRFQEAKNI